MKTKFFVLAAATVGLSQPTLAASGIKPGMWEITTQTSMPGGHAMPSMANLPPDVQAKLAAKGVNVQGGATGYTARSCVTPEQAARDEPPQQANSKCRNTSFKKSGNTITWETTCQMEGRTALGKGSMTLTSPESYSGNVNVTMNDPQHGSMSTNTQMQGRWVGPCN